MAGSFATLSNETFRWFYQSCWEELHRLFTRQDIVHIDSSTETLFPNGCKSLSDLFALLETLVSITKRNETQGILIDTVRGFGQFMTFFLGPCWTYLKKVLSETPNEVIIAIKIVQRSTRQMQSLCAHAKVTRDSALLPYVPKVKKQLEQMIYLIRETLKKEGVEDAFWMGNLKNRYLNGEEVNDEGDQQLMERKQKKRGKTSDIKPKRVKVKREKVVDMEAVEEENTEEESENNDNNDNKDHNDSSDNSDNSDTSNDTEDYLVCNKYILKSLQLPSHFSFDFRFHAFFASFFFFS